MGDKSSYLRLLLYLSGGSVDHVKLPSGKAKGSGMLFSWRMWKAQNPHILSGFVLSTPAYTLHGVCGFLVPPTERNKVASTRPILRRNVYFQHCVLFDCCSFSHRDCLAVAYIDHVCSVGQSPFLAAGIAAVITCIVIVGLLGFLSLSSRACIACVSEAWWQPTCEFIHHILVLCPHFFFYYTGLNITFN